MTLPEIIQSVGYLGVFLMVYIESGTPLGIILPLPGDTLLLASGILAAAGTFDLVPLITIIVIAAILGDSTGYWFGAKYGSKLFGKKDALFLNERNLERTVRFYEKYGKVTLVLARFLPMFRTLVPIFAGVGGMHYPTFLFWNVLGALIWGISLPLLGYFLGGLIPDLGKYLHLVVIGVMVITILGALFEWRRAKKEQDEART